MKSITRSKEANNDYEINRYKLESSYLFDIAKCKCVDTCSCVESNKLPQKLFDFLQDQRTTKIEKFQATMKNADEINEERSENKDTKNNNDNSNDNKNDFDE